MDTAFECSIERRVNRFVVEVRIDGLRQEVATNNTGRLSELMFQGKRALCLPNLHGKTAGKLLAVEDDHGWAMIDTAWQMRAFEEAHRRKLLPWLEGEQLLKRNPRLGESVLDYLFEDEGKTPLFAELKSAVFREESFASYPDCPTLRGQRHLQELTQHSKTGGRSLAVFVCALPGVIAFRPSRSGDPKIGPLLKQAVAAGVEVRSIHIVLNPRYGIFLHNADLPVVLYEDSCHLCWSKHQAGEPT